MSRHGQAVSGHPNLQFWGPNDFIRARVKVPADLRPHLPAPFTGKHELVKGLGTQCVAEAVRRSHEPLAIFHGLIKAGRAKARAAAAAAENPILITVFDPNDDSYDRLGETEWLKRFRAMKPAIRAAASSDRQFDSSLPQPIPLAGYTWQAGFEAWIAFEGEKAPAETTQEIYKSHLTRFFAWLRHHEMNRVSEQNILDYKQCLLTGSDGRRKLGNKSTNNNLASIRRVFRVAKFERKITTDPTVGTIKKLPVPKSKRKGFSREQHAQIIDYALAIDAPESSVSCAVKWLWLLGCHTGARIGELADATVSAIQQIGPFWVICIVEEHRRIWNGKAIPLKTEDSSPRILPIHSKVLRAGFLDYVAAIRAVHGERGALFPQFNPNRHGKYSHMASERSLGWLRDVVGINEGPNVLVFHSTRHALITYMRGRVTKELHDKITGHGAHDVSSDYGETELAVMARAIELIGTDSVELLDEAA